MTLQIESYCPLDTSRDVNMKNLKKKLIGH